MAEVCFHAVGRRKKAIARVRLIPGEGNIVINKRPIDEYFGLETLKTVVRQPLTLTDTLAKFDVIVTDNLFGDIITDLAAAISGGIGLAASGNINPDGTFPSMFEPVHGSAPDIAGQQLADPTAAILSVALLLTHTGHPDAAARVTAAVEADLAARGTAKRSTAQIGDDIARRVE